MEDKFVLRAENAEQEAEKISKQYDALVNEEKEKLQKNNERLQYRLNILKRAFQEEDEKEVKHMKSIIRMLKLYFTIAADKAYPGLPDFNVSVAKTTSHKFGDYQCNVAPSLAGLLKSRGDTKANPKDVANEIMKNFPDNTNLVASMDVSGPGFINVHLSLDFLRAEVKNLFLNDVSVTPLPVKKKVVVDMSAPNVAKEMHVGHLRSTIIGESISRLMTFLGYEVVRVNHIGDWGTQFGMLIAHLKDTFPDYLKEDYCFPVKDLQSFYKESKKRFDEDEDFKKRAYACVVELQAGKPDIIKAWNMICDVSRKEFSKIYERLDIKNLIERGESFYQSRMEAVVKDLEEKGLLTEDQPEGDTALKGVRKIMHGDDNCPIPLMIVKSDGGYTYDTSDLATIKHRIEEEKGDWLIYVVDAGQSTHFESVYNCAKKAGIWDPTKVRVDHVGFGVVLGEDKKKFKTRSGDTIRLVDLMDEGIKRAEEKLREKGRDKEMTPEEFEAAKTSTAYGCIKYADLSHNRNHEYVFSFDKMLDDRGNTAIYLLYAYTRIKSIARKAGVTLEQLKDYAKTKPLDLSHVKEQKLMKILLRFPEVIEQVSNNLFLHSVCELLYETATTFSEFYDNCYCIEKDKATGEIRKIFMDRLILCEATANVLKTGFDILSLQPVEKM